MQVMGLVGLQSLRQLRAGKLGSAVTLLAFPFRLALCLTMICAAVQGSMGSRSGGRGVPTPSWWQGQQHPLAHGSLAVQG